jgi:1,4-dihydroxy-2-naphthoate octaprenyltransferase
LALRFQALNGLGLSLGLAIGPRFEAVVQQLI